MRFLAMTLILTACSPPSAAQAGASSQSAVQLWSTAGNRGGDVRIEHLSGRGTAGNLIAVYDPKSSQYWWAVVRDRRVPPMSAERFERDLLPQMRFVVEPGSQIVAFWSIEGQLRVRASAMRAVSLDAGTRQVRSAAIAAVSASDTAQVRAWQEVTLPSHFVHCESDPWRASPQANVSIADAQHENRRWYVTLKNACGKRRVVTLSESFDPLD